MTGISTVEWLYMPGGKVVHAVKLGNASAECGRYMLPACDWHGTGSQVEYETAERLPMCKQCVAKASAR